MIGMAMTNVSPNLTIEHGAGPITGNNPLAFGAPSRTGPPFMLDISMSAAAGGKLLLAKDKGQKIPFGWATDKSGRPTDDPAVGFEGYLLPMAGHKGYGLSLMIDILCGVVAGGGFQFGVRNMYKDPHEPSNTGHMMLSLDPAIAMTGRQFLERMDRFRSTVKSVPTSEGKRRALLPGEIEASTKRERLAEGIPLPRQLFRDLLELFSRFDVDVSDLRIRE